MKFTKEQVDLILLSLTTQHMIFHNVARNVPKGEPIKREVAMEATDSLAELIELFESENRRIKREEDTNEGDNPAQGPIRS